MSSIFNNNLSTITATQIKYALPPPLGTRLEGRRSFGGVTSLDGIFCFAIDELSALLFNPSIRKFKLLPPLENPQQNHYVHTKYTLLYHRFTNNYKIVAVSSRRNRPIDVHSHAFGTNYWTRIQNIPFKCRFHGMGISVGDTVNWLVYDVGNRLWVILSLDLEDDSYQKFLHPFSNEPYNFNKVVVSQELKGCFCIVSQRPNFSDVWIMKEHGNEQSWTKLFSVPYMTDRWFYAYSKAVYVSEDDKVLMEFKKKLGKFSLVIYDFRNGTFNIPKIENIDAGLMIPNIYVESLILNCSMLRDTRPIPFPTFVKVIIIPIVGLTGAQKAAKEILDHLYSNLAGFWNWNVIVGVLNEGDEQEVHKLTAIDVEEEDRLEWKFNNKCIYTVLAKIASL
ncbi:F-box/kelch-repeat protein [Trifolium pratense]|uniref:F-box/kelch-repeat protein n=1 Tax=Trifolium pratense TaxID=57577 RepID=A0A2K3LPY2_TRIPR|nr:F-box/kelch-repeat protein [Trifolium pratense]